MTQEQVNEFHCALKKVVHDPQLACGAGRFAQALGIRGFVMKPVVIRELALLRRETLDGRPSAG